ncbi:MAG: PQQ-binding-like beta-propeller repeat protein, partial [Pirellulaceae bacterium]|nr:PQQ-binding-like beta-propeller repeat protein [Pirellulaceae bacterium]
GQLYWHVALPGYHYNALGGAGPRSTPTIDNGRVYAQTATGQVVCLELGTGQQHWQVDLLKLGDWDQNQSESAISWGRSASPLVTESLVVLPLGSPNGSEDETVADQPFGPDSAARSLVAFDKQNGQVVWRAGSHQISYSSPSRTKLLGVDQIVIVNETSVTGHDLSTGQVLWLVPWAGQSNGSASVSQTITVNDSQLLVSKGYSTGAMLVEFSKSDGGQWQSKQVWSKTSVLKTKFTSAVVKDEYAYALSDGVLECVRIVDGVRQWKGGRYRHGQLLLVGDTLLISAEDGAVVLVAARPNKFTELARLEVLTGVTWNVPAISGDRLLIRNADQAACLKLPLRLP